MIDAQLATISAMRGEIDKATEVYAEVMRVHERVAREAENGEGLDVALLACVANNQVALKADAPNAKLFDSLKRINLASKESLDAKLTARQSLAIGLNKVSLLLAAKKTKDARREYEELLKKLNVSSGDTLTDAALAFAENNLTKAEEVLVAASKDAKVHDPQVTAALGELYSLHLGQKDKAMAYYAKLPLEDRCEPHILDAMCAYYLGGDAGSSDEGADEKNVAEAKKALELALEKKGSSDPEVLAVCMRHMPAVNDNAFAVKAYRQYLGNFDGRPDDAVVSQFAKLLCTSGDSSAAQEGLQYAKRLFRGGDLDEPPESLWGALDAEELEAGAAPRPVKKPKVFDMTGHDLTDLSADATDKAAVAAAQAAVEKMMKKKRRSKIIYPKGFDPEKPEGFPQPDPERWLPKYEREAWKKKMAKKNKGLVRGPQGGAADNTTTVGGGDRKSGPSTANVSVGPSTAGSKKKKK